jgi:hypothetical protein
MVITSFEGGGGRNEGSDDRGGEGSVNATQRPSAGRRDEALSDSTATTRDAGPADRARFITVEPSAAEPLAAWCRRRDRQHAADDREPEHLRPYRG